MSNQSSLKALLANYEPTDEIDVAQVPPSEGRSTGGMAAMLQKAGMRYVPVPCLNHEEAVLFRKIGMHNLELLQKALSEKEQEDRDREQDARRDSSLDDNSASNGGNT